MAGQPAVKVIGAKEFRDAMKRMSADLKDMTAVHRQAGDAVADEARQIVPYVSGALQGSIRPRASKTQVNVAAGSKGVPYAGPIHFGWPSRNIRPQPFLYDALDRRFNEVVDKYEQHIEALVEKVGRETPP